MRSSSVPRFSHIHLQNIQNNENPQYPQYEQPRSNSRLAHQRNVSYKDLASMTAANTGKEILRNNGYPSVNNPPMSIMTSPTMDPPIGYNNQQSPSAFPMKTSNNWRDYIANQSEATNLVVESEKFENKVRAMKYKESLDKMMRDERQRKLQAEKEIKEGIPINYEAIKNFEKMEKIRQVEEKQRHFADLEYYRKQKEDLRKKEQIEKEKEQVDLQMRMSQVSEIEEYMNSQDKLVKKQFNDEYKNYIMQKHQQTLYERNRGQEKMNQYFMNDDERKRHYDKIRDKANAETVQFRNLRDMQYQQQKTYNEFIHKQINSKNEQDAIEAKRKEESFRKLQLDVYSSNKTQLAEKRSLEQQKKDQEEKTMYTNIQNQKMAEEILNYEKEQGALQRKMYSDALRHQMVNNKNSKLQGSHLSKAELAINFGKQHVAGESLMTSLPFVGKSYERNRQLQYLDKWLSKPN